MVAVLGHWLNQKVKRFLYALGFLMRVLIETVQFPRKKQVGFKVLVMQILFTGVEAVGIISLIALALGAVIIIQGLSIFSQFGQGELMYQVLIIIIARELGPVLTAFIMR